LKQLFYLLVFIHGLIHILGFVKAFKIAEINQLTQSISKPLGVLWLILSLLFISIAFFVFFNINWWWMPTLITIVTSQMLILFSWHDAKYGTIPNIIILIVVIIGIANWSFNFQTNKKINLMISHGGIAEKTMVTKQMLENVPFPVQKWLNKIGLVGKEKIQIVHLKQFGLMKLKPDQKKWSKVEAEQYITTDRPSFLWKVNMSMIPLFNVTGRDFFFDGQGTMKINIASLIPIANVKSNEKINQSSLQRYLLELPWYPSAALNSYIIWESLNEYSAKATMSYMGVSGSAIFYFDENSDLIKISALRYKDSDKNAKLIECIGEVKENRTINGIMIPTKIDVSWVLEEGVFTWYKLEIFEVEFNNIKQQ
jgi:hypothetical protein